jgi:hypothetical protein
VEHVARRTRELGQVLQSVENLLARCTSKHHGLFLKHTETPKTDDDFGKSFGFAPPAESTGGAGGSSGASGGAGSGGAGAGAGAGTGGSAVSVTTRRGQKALADLRVIAAYFCDFRDIVKELST